MDDLIRRLRYVVEYHAKQADYGGAAFEMHARMQTSAGDAIAEIQRLLEKLSPEVTEEAPCPICRRKTWRYAINDALGLTEPYMGDALHRAVTNIARLRERERTANEVPGLTAALDEVRHEAESLRRGMDQMRLLAGLPLPPDVARDAMLGRAVREAAARIVDADDIAITEDVMLYDDPRHSDAMRTVLVINDDQRALLADIAAAAARDRESCTRPEPEVNRG